MPNSKIKTKADAKSKDPHWTPAHPAAPAPEPVLAVEAPVEVADIADDEPQAP